MRESDRGTGTPSRGRDQTPATPGSASAVPETPSSAKPVPVRRTVPAPPKPIPARDGTAESPRGPAPVREGGPPPASPTPAAEGARPRTATIPAARDGLLDRPGARTEPARDVRLGDETWKVRLKGSATVGPGHARTRILSVALESPEGRADAVETRYVLARRLEEVGEDELLSLVREVARGPEAPSGTGGRERRGRGRRGGGGGGT